MTHAQQTAVRLCVLEALTGKWFNLAGVTKAAEVLGQPTYVPDSPDWALLKALHCKDWEHFDAETKHELVLTVGRVLGMEPTALQLTA